MKKVILKGQKLDCWNCKKKFDKGYKIEVSDTWFRGDDYNMLEYEECAIKFKRTTKYDKEIKLLIAYI